MAMNTGRGYHMVWLSKNKDEPEDSLKKYTASRRREKAPVKHEIQKDKESIKRDDKGNIYLSKDAYIDILRERYKDGLPKKRARRQQIEEIISDEPDEVKREKRLRAKMRIKSARWKNHLAKGKKNDFNAFRIISEYGFDARIPTVQNIYKAIDFECIGYLKYDGLQVGQLVIDPSLRVGVIKAIHGETIDVGFAHDYTVYNKVEAFQNGDLKIWGLRKGAEYLNVNVKWAGKKKHDYMTMIFDFYRKINDGRSPYKAARRKMRKKER